VAADLVLTIVPAIDLPSDTGGGEKVLSFHVATAHSAWASGCAKRCPRSSGHGSREVILRGRRGCASGAVFTYATSEPSSQPWALSYVFGVLLAPTEATLCAEIRTEISDPDNEACTSRAASTTTTRSRSM